MILRHNIDTVLLMFPPQPDSYIGLFINLTDCKL